MSKVLLACGEPGEARPGPFPRFGAAARVFSEWQGFRIFLNVFNLGRGPGLVCRWPFGPEYREGELTNRNPVLDSRLFASIRGSDRCGCATLCGFVSIRG